MPAYRVTSTSLTADVATLTLDSVAGLFPGWPALLSGIGHPYTGSNDLLTVDTATSSVTVSIPHANLPATDVWGQLLVQTVWADQQQVEGFLGVTPAEQTDEDWLVGCVAAANEWAYRRRKAAGYVDSPVLAPTPDCVTAVCLYAGALYRERGSIDSYQSFSDMGQPATPVGSMGQIMRLLGISRARFG